MKMKQLLLFYSFRWIYKINITEQLIIEIIEK